MTELEKAAYEWSPGEEDSRYDFMAGAKWAFQNRDVEKVLCAACHYPDAIEPYVHQPINVDNGFVVCGRRHHNCIIIADKVITNIIGRDKRDETYLKYRNMEIQGFLTSKDRFVDREEAAKIAYSAGQIASPKTELHSEDLY